MSVPIEKTRTGYRIQCPLCKRQHVLERVAPDQFMLDDEPEDQFRIEHGSIVVPDWVCRNVECSKTARLRLPG